MRNKNVVCKTVLPLIVADWEGGGIGWRVWDGTKEVHLSKEDMLSGILWLKAPVRLVIEHAHLHVRGRLSVAQVYTAPELEKFSVSARDAGAQIQAFPQRLSKRARTEGGYTSKEEDPQSIFDFIQNRPEVSLKNWQPKTSEDEEFFEEVNLMRMDMTIRLNDMRPDYDPENPNVKHAIELLNRFASGLPEDIQKQFGLEFYKRKAGVYNQGDLKPPLKKDGGARTGFNVIMAIYVAIYDSEQNLRLNKEENFIGMKFIWNYLFLMSPFSGKSGTARSNLMFRGLSAYDKRHMDGLRYQYDDTAEVHVKRRAGWSQWRKGIKHLMRSFRDAATD